MIMATWSALVSVKCNGSLNATDWQAVKAWAAVEKVWSSSGHWDYEVELSSAIQAQDELEKTVFEIRALSWVDDTQTHWRKAV